MLKIVATRAGGKEFLPDVPISDVRRLLEDSKSFVWVDISGPPDDLALQLCRDTFQFHPLAIEDCFSAREQPKVEGFEGYLYLITHGLSAGSTPEEAEVIELDAFVGKRFLVTYHLKHSRSVATVFGIIERNGGALRRGPMAVLHAILDQQVDGIEPVLDGIELRVESLEDVVFTRPSNKDLAALLALRRTILQLRRWMSKQREVMLRLARNEHGMVPAHDVILFRDIYDHLARFTDLIDSYRDMTNSIQEAYLSVTNNRLGEIMKFLTLFTAILMPLTVITGIYGMNFKHMPELETPFGYPAVLGLMAVVVLGIVVFFRKRGWLGPAARADRAMPPPVQRVRRTTGHIRIKDLHADD
jgi:magnesium transporter